MEVDDEKSKKCDMYRCYRSPATIKSIIVWDVVSTFIPVILLIISIAVYLNGEQSKEGKNFASFLQSISPVNASAGIGDQMTVISVISLEILVNVIIDIFGILAYCRDFPYISTGIYFWIRAINSVINIISHVLLFLMFGASISTLVLISTVFSFDMYLNYIIWYFWRYIKHQKEQTVSNSDVSQEISIHDDVQSVIPPNEILSIEAAKRREIENSSTSKDCEQPVRLQMDSDEMPSIDPEREYKDEELKLPSIKNRRSVQKALQTKDDNTKTTGMFDDGIEGLMHKSSFPERDNTTNYEVKGAYQTYASTKLANNLKAPSVRMVERSPKHIDYKAKTMKKTSSLSKTNKRLMNELRASQRENAWVNDDNSSVVGELEVRVKNESGQVKDSQDGDQEISKNMEDSSMPVEEVKLKKVFSNSNSDIRSRIKKLKITSQIECLDNVTSMLSDENHFRSNRK